MKTLRYLFTIIAYSIFLISVNIGCKKELPKTLPIVTTSPITNISQTSASSGGSITDDGNSSITSRGVCWSITENPTISNNKTTNGLGTGNYSSTIDNLSPGETYYVRAYATNSTGTGYGNIQTFSASERSVESDYKPIGLTFEPLEILLSIPSDDSYIPQEFPNSKSLNLNYLLNVPSPATQAGNSCVGWAVGYGLMSFLFNSLEGYEDYDGYDKVFSPYYIWNQIRTDINKNDGIWISSALNLVVNQGCCKLSDMPINESYFTSLPTLTARNNASKYKLTSFMRCSFNLNKLKSYIAFDDIPIVIGLNVDKAFQNDGDSQFEKRNGKLVWTNYIDDSREGHAVLICGFDDNINAFKVLNSWGKKWGENGYFWLDYEFAKKAINSILGIHYSIFVAHVKRPKVYTNTVSNITGSSATCGGSITRTWDLNITEQGVVWSLNQNPSIADNKVTNNTYQNNFNCTISGLSKGTKYYVKAYAINSEGISYGKQVTFTTTSTRAPDVTTKEISSISSTSAVVGGNVTSDGGSNITDRGIYYSTNTVSSGTKLQIGNGTGEFSTTLSGLTPNTTYYVKAYATNSAGTSYGSILTFKTDVTSQSPTVTTTAPANITSNSATLGGNVTSAGSSAVLERGIVYATTQNPTTSNTKIASGSGTGAYSVNATNLTSNTTYYVRAYAINTQGTAYGSEVNFSTVSAGVAPVAAFTANPTTIKEGESVQFTDLSTNNPTSWNWDFGDGSTSTIHNPSHTYSNTGVFTVALTVSNNYGSHSIVKSNYIEVNSTSYNIIDGDGNIYTSITIGTQSWLLQNLKTTKYNDGTSIQHVVNETDWSNLTTAGYCWFNNQSIYKEPHGALYNWNAVSTGKLCPKGWHVPSDNEWNILIEYNGGHNIAGGKLKEAGISHWDSPNEGATNSSGFTAIPNGSRRANGEFDINNKHMAFYWSSTLSESISNYSWFRVLYYHAIHITPGIENVKNGYSVRCVKD